MAGKLRRGTHVTWRWGAHRAEGIVAEVFTSRVEQTIKGKTIVRNATPENPAYLVRLADGAEALKSGSELTEA